MRGIRSVTFCLCLAAAIVCAAPGARAQGEEPEVEATTVTAESTVSYDHAAQKALRKAVRQVAGVELEGMTKVRDFELIRDAVFSRARGYVRRYKELNRKRGLQDTFVVRLHAEVARGQISDDALAIQSLIEQEVRPRFQVAVESFGGQAEGEPALWVETALQKALEKTGFRVVDAETYMESLRRKRKRAQLNGNEHKAAFLELQMGSVYEVKVRGTGQKREDEASGITVVNYKVQLSPKVVQRDTGDILSVDDAAAVATDRGDLGAVGWRDACNAAVKQAYPALRDGILKHWTRWLDIGRPITVQAFGVPFETVKLLRDKIRAMDTVTGARIVEAPAGGIANIRVVGRVEAADIAARIEDWTEGRLLGSTDGPSEVSANPPRDETDAGTGQEGTDRQKQQSRRGAGSSTSAAGTAIGAGDGTGPQLPPSSGSGGSDNAGEGLPPYALPAAIIAGGLVVGILGAALILRR